MILNDRSFPGGSRTSGPGAVPNVRTTVATRTAASRVKPAAVDRNFLVLAIAMQLLLLLPLLLFAQHVTAPTPPTPGAHRIPEWESRRLGGTGVEGVQALATRLLGDDAATRFAFEALPNTSVRRTCHSPSHFLVQR